MSGASCKANGAVYPAASAMMNSVKKPKMEQIQADHELFLQAFESENSLLAKFRTFRDHKESIPPFLSALTTPLLFHWSFLSLFGLIVTLSCWQLYHARIFVSLDLSKTTSHVLAKLQ